MSPLASFLSSSTKPPASTPAASPHLPSLSEAVYHAIVTSLSPHISIVLLVYSGYEERIMYNLFRHSFVSCAVMSSSPSHPEGITLTPPDPASNLYITLQLSTLVVQLESTSSTIKSRQLGAYDTLLCLLPKGTSRGHQGLQVALSAESRPRFRELCA